MYLKGSKWSMRKRRRPVNWFNIGLLSLLVVAAVYLNQVWIPTVPPIGVPTATPTRDPESFATEAEGYFTQGKLFQAIDAYTQAIRSDPQNPGYYTDIARAQIYAGLYEDALNSAEKALLLNPNNPKAHTMRAWALDFLGDYLAAEGAVKSAIELDANSAMAHAIYAEILADQYINNVGALDTIERAAEESRVAISLDDNLLESRRARGYVLYITDNREQAITEYQAAININPNIPDLHLQLGVVYRSLGVNDKAVDEYLSANVLNPSDPTPDLYISRAYGSIGEYAKAEQYAKSAVTDEPTDPYLRGNWGVWLYQNLLWPEAADQLGLAVNGGMDEEGVRIAPLQLTNDIRTAEYFYTYALVLARLGRCSEVIDVAQRIINTIPTDETAAFNAQESLRICQENVDVTPTVEPPDGTPTP